MERVAYTNRLFDLLAQLVPNGIEGSVNAVGVPLLTSQALKDMHQQGGQISFLLGSGGAVVMPRFPHYFEVPELLARADPDPYHS